MARPVASASAQPRPQTETKLSLTDVEITFLKKRPKTKIKLAIELEGKDYEAMINKDDSIRWTGDIPCLPGAKIEVQIHRPKCFRRWKKIASIELSLAEHSPMSATDAKLRISVNFRVASPGRESGQLVESNPPQAPSTAIHREAGTDDPQFLDAVTAAAAAKETVGKATVVTEKLGKIWNVLKFVDAIGEPLKEIHPAVGIAMAAVSSLVKLFEKQQACRDEASDLIDQLMSFLTIKEHIEKLKKRSETRRAVQVMLVLISDASKYICEKTESGFGGIIGDLIGSEYQEEIDKLQKQFMRAKESFDRSVELEIFAMIDEIALDTQFLRLHEKLSECDEAHFRPGDGCLPGTRTDLCQRAMNWIDNTDETQFNLFWLFGNAGSGKSTVANTVATMVDPDRGYQLSCFLCKRDDPSRSNPRKVLPTLAYRFAQQHEGYRAAIMNLLRDSVRGAGIATTADIDTQFRELFAKPIKQTLPPARPHVIIVDALDECGTPEERAQLAVCMLALSRIAPWIKVFITSRNESAIRRILLAPTTDCISCDINDEKGVDHDIERYIESRAERLNLPLSGDDVQKLVRQAAGLFIWCRTLFEYLGGGFGAKYLLAQMLSGESQHDSSQPWSPLYSLYDTILDSAVARREADTSFMREILSIISASTGTRPLSIKAIISFLHGQKQHMQFDDGDAEDVIKKLHAVLYVDANGAVRAYHASLYDFLAWKASTSTDPGWKTPGETHRLMALGCIKTLRADLKFNICGIDTPVLNKNIPDLATRVATNVSEALQYSCQFWFIHVPLSTLTPADVEKDVSDLLRTKMLLFWFESLSLLGLLRQIQFSFRRCMRTFFQTCPTIAVAAEDACRIVSSFADAMDSVPHIYLSALLWLPEDSTTYKNLGLSKKTSWHLIENKRKNWDALVWESGLHSALSIAFSPDGRFVAYGTYSGDVYIRDSQTGALEGEPFRGHQEAVRSVAYSHDGRFIATGSEDKNVRLWNVKTGEAIFAPLEGHSERVRCVAFSPDGLFIASASDDGTIRIWNAQTGISDGEPLTHRGGVNGLAFSPDGRFIASGCDDQCVHVWCTSLRQEASISPFQGHQDQVWAVAYSPDGRTIVSGSRDNTIHVWDAKSGKAIGDPLQGHTGQVTSVVHSPSGRLILSGSGDGTVRLWDAATRAPIGIPLQTLSGAVWSVAYCPDGSLIASAGSGGVRVWDASTCFTAGSQSFARSGTGDVLPIYAIAYSPDGLFIASGTNDDQIRIWNAHTGAAVDQPVLRHSGMQHGGSILSVAYSPDGRYIVSGSDDGDNSTVCVLNVQTGATIGGPFQGHYDSIMSVAYSLDGRFVASASQDKTVRLWDVRANAASGEPLQVGSSVNSVAFSPDGRLLACGNDDGRIWLWDANTRAAIREPIQAHFSNHVYSVAFSPDGRHIASGSSEQSVKIWDVHTGETSGAPLHGLRGWIRCVAYSPNGRCIASSSGGEVIIWDVQSGSSYRELRGPPAYINSIAYSPDGRFLVSGAGNGNIYVHEVSIKHDGTEARWLAGCSRMDVQDGWVKDGDTLLLWVPVPHRDEVQFCARHIMPDRAPNVAAYSIDYRTLLTRYSGRNWTDIFAGFND